MFHVYTAAPRPTPERSHQPHRKTPAPAETNPHQQSPEYTQHTPKTGTHGEQAPSHPPVHITPTHQRPPACSGQRYAKAAHTDKRRWQLSENPPTSPQYTLEAHAATNTPQRNQPNHPQGTRKTQSKPRTSQW